MGETNKTTPQWRNWHTRTAQNRIPQGLEVQILSGAKINMENKSKYVFIDAENLFYSQRTLGWRI